VVPFYEDDVVGLTKTLGVDHVLGGSDYPHPEGLRWPSEFADELGGLAAAAVRRIMRENLAELVL
jgi:predicted TIM-barrel fold metal-dependent hydrolase